MIAEKKVLYNIMHILSGHEFRTPLAAIDGFARIMKDADISEIKDEKNIFLQYIIDASERLSCLSERLNTWYELKTICGFEEKILDLHTSTIDDILKDESAKYPGTQCSTAYCDGFNTLKIKAPEILFTKCLSELSNNACKFSLPGTLIQIKAITINNELCISISNYSDKTTITELKTYKSFSQFNRCKFEQQGLGLGLSISRLAIVKMRGKMRITGLDTCDRSEITISIQIPLHSEE